jgi:S-formylglutathione hydrolase
MAGLEIISEARCFGGRQITYRHLSRETKTPMRFAVYLPPQAEHDAVPVLWWLSGLTCTEENFSTKAGAQRIAAELGLMLVIPDTSPRGVALDGQAVPDDPEGAFDFGLGAGFYVDATEAPWSANYRMYSYITAELPEIIAATTPADMTRQSISGHSMGGHGALTIALRHPGHFRSVSAFAPIAAPMQGPWGRKAFSHYLGSDETVWRLYDAAALVADGARAPEILVDQGTADPWLEKELRIEEFEAACALASQPLILRRQLGYDHGFYFIASFIEDHLRWHAARLYGHSPD